MVGHSELGHADDHDEQDGPKLSRSDREVEAESVAYLVTAALGLSGREYSAGYLQHWLKAGDRLTERTAQRIFTTADRILHAGRLEPSTHDAESAVDDSNDRNADR